MENTGNQFLFILLIVISFVGTLIYRYLALKKSILDIPNERSSHITPTPRGGGLAIVIAFYTGLFWLFFKNSVEESLFYSLLTGLVLVIIGLLDDVLDLPPLLRFILQAVVAVTSVYLLGGLKVLDCGIFEIENILFLSILTIIGMIWFINLFNFIDGIDGYASMQAIFVSGAMLFLTKNSITLILAFATLGFLPWNWQRAKIFLGDVGSTLLGFILAVFAIYFQNSGELSLVHWLILTSLFWFDATFTLFRRWRNGEKLGQAHRKHAYQRLVLSGYSHQKVVLFGLVINLLLFCIVLIFKHGFMIIAGFMLSILLNFSYSFFVDKRKSFPKNS